MAFIIEYGTDGDDTIVGVDGNDYSFNGAGGNDTLVGANGNDSFHGGAGADIMHGGAGDDQFNYLAGESILEDTLDGGDGFDNIHFLSKAGERLTVQLTDAMRLNIEQITGHDGGESFFGADLTGAITLDGGAGNDLLEGGAGDDILVGGAGSDHLIGNGGADIMFGGDGNDNFFYNPGQTNAGDVIDGGAGIDTVIFYSEAGTRLDVTLQANSFTGIERVYGGQGYDIIDASSLSDKNYLDGDAGNDLLIGGAGNDLLVGGAGSDHLVGNEGADGMYGGAGNDNFFYDPSQTNAGDYIDGGDGIDTVIFYSEAGTRLDVTLQADSFRGIERVYGGQGHDLINASGLSDNVYLDGDAGDDYLAGGFGDDLLFGGAGRDQLQGNGGKDLLFGGDGDDIFVFGGNSGTWTVADFTQGLDHIWIDVPGGIDFAYILEHAVEIDGNTHITIGDSTMIVQQVGIATLQASDFWL
jgi:Ca2+-binding RTX toxin-like protein